MESVCGRRGRGGGHGNIAKGEAKRRRKGRKGEKEERRRRERKEGEALHEKEAQYIHRLLFTSVSMAASLWTLREAPLIHPTLCPDLRVSNN